MSVRLDRLQKALYVALSGLALAGSAPAAVAWAQSQAPRQKLDGDLIELRLTSGPVRVRQALSGKALHAASAIDLTVAGVTAGVMSIVRLNGFSYRREAGSGDTVTTIRDALLTEIRDGEAGAVTVAPLGADALRFSADFAGGLWALELVGDLAASNRIAGDEVIVTESTNSMLVTLQAFTRGREPRSSAAALLDLAIDRLRAYDILELLDLYGIAVWDYGGPVDLSAIAGGNWESRAACDLTIAAQGVAVRKVSTIEHVQIHVNVGLVPGGKPIESFTATADLA